MTKVLRSLIQEILTEGMFRRRDFVEYLMDRGLSPETGAMYARVVEELIGDVNTDDDATVRSYIPTSSTERWRVIRANVAWNAYQQFLYLNRMDNEEDPHLDAEIDQTAPLRPQLTALVDEFLDTLSSKGANSRPTSHVDRPTLRRYKVALIRMLKSLEDRDPLLKEMALVREVVNSLTADPVERRLLMKIWRLWNNFLKDTGWLPRYWGDVLTHKLDEGRNLEEASLAQKTEEYVKHTALNLGQAARAVVNLHKMHPDESDLPRSIRRSLLELANNLYYAIIPPHTHHTPDELKDLARLRVWEWFLCGYGDREYWQSHCE
jgi:hypothetical protein